MNQILTKDTVPLRTGPPTREELMVYYPAKYTWEQLRIFVNSGSVNISLVAVLGTLNLQMDTATLVRSDAIMHCTYGMKSG